MNGGEMNVKVLMVNTVPTEKNGITNVIFNLIEAFDRNNFTIGYVSISDPDEYYRERLKSIGVKFYVIKRKISSPLQYIKELAKIAKNYDIVHSHGNSATMILEMFAAKMAGVKVRASHSHNTRCKMRIIDAIFRPMFYKICNLRLACGEEAGKWLYRNKSFHIVHNGVVTKRYGYNVTKRESIRKSLNIGDSYVVGHIGNFIEAKNHVFLIDLFAEFSKTNTKSVLLLVGDGILRRDIEKKVMQLGLWNQVIFAGSVENPEDYMCAMDIVVMPSKYEGLPLTLIEEQANGLDIIASDAITEDANLTGCISYVTLDNDVRPWIQAIKRCSENGKCRSKEVSDKAILSIKKKKYDIVDSANNLMRIYERCLIG